MIPRFGTRVLVLVGLLLGCTAGSAHAQLCSGLTSYSSLDPTPGVIEVGSPGLPGATPPAGSIVEIIFGVSERVPGACASIGDPQVGFVFGNTGWVTAQSLFPDSRVPFLWHWRLKLAPNTSGLPRQVAVSAGFDGVGGNIYYLDQGIPAGCYTSLFDAEEIAMSPNQNTPGQSVHIDVINDSFSTCSFRVRSLLSHINQLPTLIEGDGAPRTSVDGFGTIPPGVTVHLTITPLGYGNDACAEKLSRLVIDIDEQQQQRGVLVRQPTIVGPPPDPLHFFSCGGPYGRIRATPISPDEHKPPVFCGTSRCAGVGGVRG